MKKIIFKRILVLGAFLPLYWGATVLGANAEDTPLKPTAEGIVDANNANIAPRLEIRKYRFFHDSKLSRERLVLEFDRRDFYHENKPRLSFEAITAQEIAVKLDNVVLMGAIPESLINDSYANTSQYMGPISMDDRATNSGFGMKVKLKDFDLGYNAEWLTSPDRLVVDVFPKKSEAARKAVASAPKSRQPKSLSVEHRGHIPGIGDFMCFPAKAKVGLAVVFQPNAKVEEDIQKFRVNIDGSSAGLVTAVDRESIVCYPKNSQVKASLSFMLDESSKGSEMSGGSSPATSLLNLSNETANPPAPASASLLPPIATPQQGSGIAAPVTGGSDSELEPPSAGGAAAGQAPSGGSLGPASLLPPIGK